MGRFLCYNKVCTVPGRDSFFGRGGERHGVSINEGLLTTAQGGVQRLAGTDLPRLPAAQGGALRAAVLLVLPLRQFPPAGAKRPGGRGLLLAPGCTGLHAWRPPCAPAAG